MLRSILKTMLRSILLAFGISFLCGEFPAVAAQSCYDFCMQNRCAHGVISQPKCMNKCTSACQQKHPQGR
jgi:hypothetical protein